MQGEVIAIADIEGAERVMGVAYTAAERSQMVGNLQGQIASALSRRRVRLDNSMPMASRFDPRLPTFRMPAPQRPLRFTRASAEGRSATMTRTSPSRQSGSFPPGSPPAR